MITIIFWLFALLSGGFVWLHGKSLASALVV